MNLLGLAVLFLLLGVLLAQWWLRRKARRLEGAAPPPLDPAIDACLRERGKVLLYFHSPACGPCRKMTPLVDAAAARHGNVFKLDVAQSLEVARKLGVMATPTTVVIAGGRIASIDLGPLSEKELEGRLAGA